MLNLSGSTDLTFNDLLATLLGASGIDHWHSEGSRGSTISGIDSCDCSSSSL